ncbi:MAG TPA: tetratricopeptide repeat protein [Acidobacteriaceae bacterium]|jgi:tetratricopeptide (TPR) repeat protein|nr:tetratricopeptide repeat protein [Acidobacteriaceae bacterium]
MKRGAIVAAVLLLIPAGLSGTARAQQLDPTMSGAPPAHGSPLAPAGERELGASSASDPVLRQTLSLIQSREYPAASQKIQDFLKGHPESGEAHFLFGYILYRQQKPRESLAEYTEGARFQKPQANDLAAVAMDYILLRDYADADKWLTQATAWSPQNELYWYYLGRTKYAENHFDEAILAFNHCLALQPRDLRAKYNMGLAYAGLGRNADAIAAYRTAIDWQQNAAHPDPQPWLDLGILLLDQSQPRQALPWLEKAAGLAPDNPRAREELGQAYEQLHNLTAASREMEAAVALAPNIPSLHFELGRIDQRLGLAAKAKEEFARCAVLNAAHSTDATETPNPAPK